MHRWLRLLCALVSVAFMAACESPPSDPGSSPDPTTAEQQVPRVEWGLVVHGGAGTIPEEETTPEREEVYRAALTAALHAGHEMLRNGGASLDAVAAALVVLEDSPLFNAGKGAVFTADGVNSLDASIMDGATRRAGAVAGVTDVKNPIRLARLVMEKSAHVMLSGAGAEQFAREQGWRVSRGSTSSQSVGGRSSRTRRPRRSAGTSSAQLAPSRWTGTVVSQRGRPPAA